MSLMLIIFFSVCALLLLASLADILLNPRVSWQDFIWRLTLIAVLLLPALAMLGRATWPSGLIQLPILASESVDKSQELKMESKNDSITTHVKWDAVDSKAESAASLPIDQADESGLTKTDNDSEELFAHSTPIQEFVVAHEELTAEAERSLEVPWTQLAMTAWMLGSFYFLSRFIIGWLEIRSVVARAMSIEPEGWSETIDEAKAASGVRTRMSVRASRDISTPMVVGILSPIVLVPEAMTQLSCSDLRIRATLSHEAMHIRRSDSFWNLMLCICVVAWWPIPLVHWMRKRMFWLRELLCDAGIAVEMGPANYSEALLQMTKRADSYRVNAFAIPMLARDESLESRVRWILNLSNPVPKPGRIGKLIVACGLAALLFSVTAVTFVPAGQAFSTQNDPEPNAAIYPEKEAETASNEDGPECRGVVKTTDGKVVAGATVYFLKRKGSTLPTYPLKTTTDENGEYVFDNVVSGRYRIWAEVDGLTSLKRFLGGARVDVTKEQELISIDDIVVTKACDYRVTVVSEETKKPIEGTRIHFGWTDIEREYSTGMDGVASIRGLAANDWYFVVKADGYATYFKKTAPQTLGSTTDLTFELKPGANVEFDLKDQNEEPIPGAIVEIQYEDISMIPHLIPYPSRTDTDGKLLAKGMPLNTKLRLIVSKDGYRFNWSRKLEFDGKDGIEKVKLNGEKMPYGGDVALEITDEKGDPIEGAKIKNPSTSSGRYRETTTNSNGKASLENLYPSFENKYVIVKSEGMLPQRLNVEPGPQGRPTTIKVAMKPGKRLKGVVLTPDGKPAPENTRVYFNRGEQGKWDGGSVSTDAEGKFAINGLPDLTTLTVYTPREYEPIENLKVELDKEGDVTIKIIKMTPAAVLRIRAVDEASGEPIPEFNVRIGFVDRGLRLEGDKTSGILSELSNPGKNIHGTQKVYRLDHQVAGTVYKVIVSAKGYETKTIHRMQTVVESESKLVDVSLSKAEK